MGGEGVGGGGAAKGRVVRLRFLDCRQPGRQPGKGFGVVSIRLELVFLASTCCSTISMGSIIYCKLFLDRHRLRAQSRARHGISTAHKTAHKTQHKRQHTAQQ